MPEFAPASTLEVETAVQVTRSDPCLSSATATNPPASTAAAAETADQAAIFLERENQIRQMQYNEKMKSRWMWIIHTTLMLAVFAPLFLRQRGPWFSPGIILFLCAWSLWTGTQDAVLLFVQTSLPLSLNFGHDEATLWAPAAVAALTVVMFQAIYLHGGLQQKRAAMLSSPSLNLSPSYPLRFLPSFYTFLFLLSMIPISLLVWVQAWLILRRMIQTLATLTAVAGLVMSVEFALFLMEVDGWWWTKQCMLDNFMASNTLCSLMMFTSMTSLLLSTLCSDDWTRIAFFFAFSNAANVASSFVRTCGSLPNPSSVAAKGCFAPSTRLRSMFALLAFFALALAIWMPLLIVTLLYTPSKTPPVTVEDLWLIILIATAWVVSIVSILVLSYVICPMKPLQWTISTSGRFVVLSVETFGITKCYHHVVSASKVSVTSCSTKIKLHVTDTNHGRVVVVEYVPLRYWHDNILVRSNNLHVYMTPEDPDAFLEMIALAAEQAKRQ
jgi:hypothetical protein